MLFDLVARSGHPAMQDTLGAYSTLCVACTTRQHTANYKYPLPLALQLGAATHRHVIHITYLTLK